MRKIIIGDVHGCLKELQELIALISLQSNDELVFVGDLLDKGPDGLGVWRYVKNKHNFNCKKVIYVWGNHEDKHYRYYRKPQNFSNPSNDLQLQAQFNQSDFDFFEDFVLYHYDPLFHLLIIHGGVLEKVQNLEYFPYQKATDYYRYLSNKKAKPFLLNLRVRYVDREKGHFLGLGKEKENDPFWAQTYDGRLGTIVFGHEAFQDVKVFDHAFGIDTGAVYGNKLSAIVFEKGGAKTSMISVKSQTQYDNNSFC